MVGSRGSGFFLAATQLDECIDPKGVCHRMTYKLRPKDASGAKLLSVGL